MTSPEEAYPNASEDTALLGGDAKQTKGASQSAGERRLYKSLEDTGYGFFHVILTIVCGWGLASDSVEVLCISFAIPVAEGELGLSDYDKSTLDSIIFIGMMIGGLFWGSWSDAVGRRTCLVNSLLLNGASGFLSGFMPNFGSFLFFRLLSGIGVGGSMPVVFSYFSEFFTPRKKGPLVIVLASFWMLGQVYTAFLAWALLNHPCAVNAQIGSLILRSWRVFVMLCTVPALSAAVCFIFLPESPSWLYQTGRLERAEKTLQRVRRINGCCRWRHSSTAAPLHFVDVDDSTEGSAGNGESVEKVPIREKLAEFLRKLGEKIVTMVKTVIELFRCSYIHTSVVMIVIYLTLSFGYYGLQLWFPEYFKLLLNGGANVTHPCSFTGNLNCTQLEAMFAAGNCDKIYQNTLWETLATVPGTILGILTINLVGGRAQLSSSMIISGIGVLLIWLLPPVEYITVLLSCIFSGFAIIGWNALDVLSIEYFPTHLRSTAFGLLTALSRVASIVSIYTFGSFQSTNPAAPILIVAIFMITGGAFSLLLPLSKDPARQSLLGKALRPYVDKLLAIRLMPCPDRQETLSQSDVTARRRN